MNKRMSSIVKSLLCIVLVMVLISGSSKAEEKGFQQLVKSPTISIATPSNKKLEEINVTIKTPGSTIKDYNIYKDNKAIKFQETSKKNNEVQLKIKKSDLPAKNKSANIKIYARANNMEYMNRVIKVTNKKGKYYEVTNAPTFPDLRFENNNIIIDAKSNNIKRIKIVDYNASKSVYDKDNINKNTATVKIDRTKLKLKNDTYYRLTMYVYDKSGTYTEKAVAFKLPDVPVAVVDNPDDTNDNPVITEVTCKHAKIKYNTTKDSHTKICAECGANLGKEYHIFGGYYTSDTHEATGKCKICNYECKHTDVFYEKIRAWHAKICNTCGKELGEEKHTLKNGECTVCKASDSNIGTMYYRDNDNSLKMLNRSPSIGMSRSSSKVADVKIFIEGIKIKQVKIYEVDAQGNNKREIKLEKSKESTENKEIYVLSHKNLLKGGTHNFYITAKNKYGTTTKYYTIRKKTTTENGKKIEYYSVNSSPNLYMYGSPVPLSNISFYAVDNSGIESIKITDMNNNNKEVATYTAKDVMTAEKIILLNVEKECKAKNGVYKLKVEMKDRSKSKKVSTRTVVIDTKTKGWTKYTTLYRWT